MESNEKKDTADLKEVDLLSELDSVLNQGVGTDDSGVVASTSSAGANSDGGSIPPPTSAAPGKGDQSSSPQSSLLQTPNPAQGPTNGSNNEPSTTTTTTERTISPFPPDSGLSPPTSGGPLSIIPETDPTHRKTIAAEHNEDDDIHDHFSSESSPKIKSPTIRTEEEATSANLDKIARLYEKYSTQCGELERLEKQNGEYREQLLTAMRERDVALVQVKESSQTNSAKLQELERSNMEKEYQLKAMKDRTAAQENHFRKSLADTKAKSNLEIEKLKKTTETAQREKNESVIKYAKREAEVLTLEASKQKLGDQLRQMTTERDALMSQLRGARNEKDQLKQNCDLKESDTGELKREMERQRNLVQEGEIRVKIANKRVDDVEAAHKETKLEVERLNVRLKEAKEETETIRRDCQNILKQFQEKAEQNTVELKTQTQEKSDQEEIHKKVMEELDMLKRAHKETLKDQRDLTEQLKGMETREAGLNTVLDEKRKEVDGLTEELERIRPLAEQVESIQSRCEASESSARVAIEERTDAEREAAACREQAEHMLTLTQKLTADNTELQTVGKMMEQKIEKLEADNKDMSEKLDTATNELELATNDLEQMKACSSAELTSLRNTIQEKLTREQELETAVEDERNNIKVLKKKHAANIRELKSETSIMKRRLEAYENGTNSDRGSSTGPNAVVGTGGGDRATLSSRASSISSLNDTGGTGPAGQSIMNYHQHSSSSRNPPESPPPRVNHNNSSSSVVSSPVQSSSDPSSLSGGGPSSLSGGGNLIVADPGNAWKFNNQNLQLANSSINPNQAMIEKIVKLQKALARRAEKIEFLEEHVKQCLNELQKKAKIIQNFALREEAGALAPISTDMNKAEMARRGSTTMSSLYQGPLQLPPDGTITLDLSIQINSRLQAVLEDTLHKNITLKDSMETLGQEISRLSRENRDIKVASSSRNSSNNNNK